jgi:hypothetical protein
MSLSRKQMSAEHEEHFRATAMQENKETLAGGVPVQTVKYVITLHG